MNTFFSFLPIIITAIFAVFVGFVVYSRDENENKSSKHHRHPHNHKTA